MYCTNIVQYQLITLTDSAFNTLLSKLIRQTKRKTDRYAASELTVSPVNVDMDQCLYAMSYHVKTLIQI